MPFQVPVLDLLPNVEFAGVFRYGGRLAFVVGVFHNAKSVSRGMADLSRKYPFEDILSIRRSSFLSISFGRSDITIPNRESCVCIQPTVALPFRRIRARTLFDRPGRRGRPDDHHPRF